MVMNDYEMLKTYTSVASAEGFREEVLRVLGTVAFSSAPVSKCTVKHYESTIIIKQQTIHFARLTSQLLLTTLAVGSTKK